MRSCTVVNEPTAAAIAHGLDNASTGRILVFDLGGGTFDVTVMEVAPQTAASKVAGHRGDRRLGGMDFDNLIVDKMITTARQGGLDIQTEPWARQDAYGKAEALKKELSTLDTAAASLTGSGRPLPFKLRRAVVREADPGQDHRHRGHHRVHAGDGLRRPVRHRHRADGRRVEPDPRVPADARAHLRQATGVLRNLDEDVARGAAMLGAKEGQDLDPRSVLARIPKPVDVCSHGLYLGVNDEQGAAERHHHRGAVTGPGAWRGHVQHGGGGPDPRRDQAERGRRGRPGVRQGDRQGHRPVGRPVPKGYPITVKIDYRPGMIERNAYDGETGAFLCKLEVERPGNLSSGQVANAAEIFRKTKVS